MENIKRQVNAYRDAIRHLWNSAFSSLSDDLRYGACLESFEEIDFFLFKALIFEPFDIKSDTEYRTNNPIDRLKVKPCSEESFSVLVNRDKPASGYWDYPVNSMKAADVDLTFISFFDWDTYGQMDCRYYRVRITDCKNHADLIDRDALIETFYADVFLATEARSKR
jgi:hypothetical protein